MRYPIWCTTSYIHCVRIFRPAHMYTIPKPKNPHIWSSLCVNPWNAPVAISCAVRVSGLHISLRRVEYRAAESIFTQSTQTNNEVLLYDDRARAHAICGECTPRTLYLPRGNRNWATRSRLAVAFHRSSILHTTANSRETRASIAF